ncbi:phage tail tape measure protein [Williamsia phyllosphaerae]|uniref:Phage tail tape measure protein domain-containing protein n=1 Tax=Williamsia phyllosphaerae TaxID=885042 RepID=A0ABQ1V603_9NOCA|nr:phage tail tape measure protein [Williamsia phyllosphaerae]GGF39167.1 hypothetical protein GCM10007298_38570 [Williamsia phyllosphaerae]
MVAETSGIPRQIRSAFGSAQRDADSAGRNSGRSFASSFGSSLKGLGAAAGVTGGIAAVAGAMKSAISSGMDFTTSLNTMQAVAGASADQVARVGQMARQLGTDNSLAATSSVDAAQAMLELAKGGFTVDQSMQAARGTLQLAAAAQISAGEAATIQSQALQAFGQNASFAGTASDILANSANASSAEITDVAQALQQSGTVANQFGISMNDTAAAISLMANSGIKGSDAGTLLKSALLALTDQGKPAQSAMEELGITAYDAQGKFVGLSSLFGQLQTASKGMSAEQYQAATSVLFGSDAMRIAGIAAQQGKTGFDQMSAAMGRQGAAADVAAAKMQGLPGAWEKLKNEAQDAGLAFYDLVKGPLTAAANSVSSGIGGAVDAIGRLGGEGLDKLRDLGFLSQAGTTFEKLRDAVVAAAPGLGQIAKSLAEAAAVIGGATWLAFSGALQVAAGALQVIAPLLESVGDLMQGNQTLVTALLGAYLAFKIIPGIVGRIGSAFSPITSRISATTSSVGSFNDQVRRLQTVSATTGTSVGRLGAQMAILGSNSPAIGRMRQAFVDASSAASRMPRTVGTAAGALSGLRTGIGAVSGAMGGPLGIALAAGTIAMGVWGKSQADAARDAAENKRQIDELSQAINFQTGALDAQGKKKVFDKLSGEGVFDTVDKNPQLGVSAAQVQSAAEGQKSAIDTVNAALDRQAAKSIENSKYWQTNGKDYAKAGVSMQELTAAVRGNGDAQEAVKSKLQAAGWENYDSAVGRARNGLDSAGQSAVALGEKIGSTNETLGKSQERARQEAEALGLVSQRFEEIAKQFATPGTTSIQVDTSQIAGAEDRLKSLGFTTRSLPNGKVEITANDEAARARLQFVSTNVNLLNALTANPKIGLNDDAFSLGDQKARNTLRDLSGQIADPKAKLTITDLINGKAVSLAELQQLDQTISNPQVRADVTKALQNIDAVNKALDQAARTRIANITAQVQGLDFGERTQSGRVFRGPGLAQNADGSIRQYANGGINALESYANGKLPTQAVIQKAQPNSLVQWAEPETGGEAFIPLAQGKRGRSTSILTAVAQMFGFDLVPQGNLSGTVSGMAGALSGGAVSGLLARTGLDRMYKFAAGGVTAEGLKALAQGTGASRPLTGAPYVWGGTNWGDCSGAMSAFARFAAGLDPFGGRFSTATMGAQLQQMGFSMGRGTSGDLRFGWHNGGPGGGHTSGTLPDGTAIEMGGGNGGGMLGGGAANADDPQHNEHAYMTIGPAYTDAGADPGGFVVRPDGTIAFNPGNGNFSAGGSSAGSSAGSAESGGTSLSTRLGSAAGSFIEGQIASMLSVLSVNDSPGALAAIAEYENQVKSSKSGSGSGSAVDPAALKTSYETAKAEADKRYEAEVLRRKQEYEAERKKLQDQQKATKDVAKKAELDRKLADLKTKYENDSLAAKQKHDDAALQAKQKFDEVKKTGASANSAASAQQSAVTDPGSTVPKKGEDLGVRAGVSGGGIKEAFKSGLRDAWRVGQPWTDSEWIVNKESSWNPAAKNGKYFGLIQAGPEVYQAAGKSPTTTDPREQGQVFDKYVGDRYQDPMRARAHHQANNWYDQGGAAIGTGLMAKNVIAPERVLSPRQTAAFESMVQRDFQAGGGTGALEEKFDRLIDLMSKRPPLMPVVVPDEAGRRRVERDRTVQRHLVSK